MSPETDQDESGTRGLPVCDRATARRAFLQRMTGAAAALAVAPLVRDPLAAVGSGSLLPTPPAAGQQPRVPWSDAWLEKLTGKHKQFFDTLQPNDGFSLAFAKYFLDLNHETYGLTDNQLTAVVGLRHFAMPMALPDALWERYRIGENTQISDRTTGGPATRNPFLHRDGVPTPGSDITSLMQRGVIFTVCNVALTTLSARMASGAGVSADAAKTEWTKSIVPGMILVPVGVMAVNLAQERGLYLLQWRMKSLWHTYPRERSKGGGDNSKPLANGTWAWPCRPIGGSVSTSCRTTHGFLPDTHGLWSV